MLAENWREVKKAHAYAQKQAVGSFLLTLSNELRKAEKEIERLEAIIERWVSEPTPSQTEETK